MSPRNLSLYCSLALALGAGCANPQLSANDAGPDLTPVQSGDSLPKGAVSFFNARNCPSGWAIKGSAAGRFVVPTVGSNGGDTIQGEPLASGEDRPHTHSISASFSTTSVSYVGLAGTSGNLAAAGNVDVNATSQAASTGLPYVQLLICQKTTTPDPIATPVPSGMTMFYSGLSDCPSGWSQVTVSQGRHIVGLPNPGAAGVTFGSTSLNSQEARMHSHSFNGQLQTTAYGVALSTGCCGSGYAQNSTYSYSGTSTQNAAQLPYVQLLHCQKN